MTPTEILDKLIFSSKSGPKLRKIRRLWLEHLEEVANRITVLKSKRPKDYTVDAMISILAAWIISVSIYLNFAG